MSTLLPNPGAQRQGGWEPIDYGERTETTVRRINAAVSAFTYNVVHKLPATPPGILRCVTRVVLTTTPVTVTPEEFPEFRPYLWTRVAGESSFLPQRPGADILAAIAEWPETDPSGCIVFEPSNPYRVAEGHEFGVCWPAIRGQTGPLSTSFDLSASWRVEFHDLARV